MTTPDQEAKVRRLWAVEHWKVGTIATQLDLHTDAVKRILGLGVIRPDAPPRPCLADPYSGFIAETLERYPRLCASRLWDMVRERGYPGAERTLRDYVAKVRPGLRREVYLRTESLPGEQAQIDWAYVSKISVDGTERGLWMFVMVLSHSRAMWGEFVIDLTVHSLCRSLVRASQAFGGMTRQWLFDNPKIVVIEREGDAVRFHPTLRELCDEMHVEPRLCAVRRPEHKGKVERAIRYVRDRFLSGRMIASIADGNTAFLRFIDETAHARPHPVLAPETVANVFAEERPRLLLLPSPPPNTDAVIAVKVDRQAFVRFDTNRYSVPPQYAERTLSLVADDMTVRALSGAACVATHARSYGRRRIIEDSAHRAEIVSQRRQAADLKGRDRLRAVAPSFASLLERWALGGRSLAIQVTRAIKLLDLYGDEIFAAAVAEIVERGLHDVGALAVACDRRRRAQNRAVPIDVEMPSHIEDREVVPHDLETYDDH